MGTCSGCSHWKRWLHFDRASVATDANSERLSTLKPAFEYPGNKVAADGEPLLGVCWVGRSTPRPSEDKPCMFGECQSEDIPADVVTNGIFGCVLFEPGTEADHTHVYQRGK